MSSSLSIEARIFDAADRSAPIKTLQTEIDVSQFEDFSQAELAAVGVGREVDSLVLSEIVKKKTRFWLPRFWRRIIPW